jgi:hypothetical protein
LSLWQLAISDGDRCERLEAVSDLRTTCERGARKPSVGPASDSARVLLDDPIEFIEGYILVPMVDEDLLEDAPQYPLGLPDVRHSVPLSSVPPCAILLRSTANTWNHHPRP